MSEQSFSRTFTIQEEGTACDLLAVLSGLPKGRIKDCMTKGGVWWSRPKRSTIRLRRATTEIHSGERLEINYDPAILALAPPQPELVHKTRHYSVWNKPAGLLAQGTRFADHCSLPRMAQARLGAKNEFHPVHRLDREARGLMLLAHNGRSAAQFSELFRSGTVHKEYTVIVRGIPDWLEHTVNAALDGKDCTSHLSVIQVDPNSSTALLTVRINSGRKHQIRRHLAGIGFPVLGDPRYGQRRGNELQLLAHRLAFTCPITGKALHWELPLLAFPPSMPQQVE